MSKKMTSRWKSIRKSILAQVVMLNAEMKEIKVSDELTLYAGDDLAMDVLVFTIENEPFVNGTFEFEEKVYTTGENGEIVDIQEVSKDPEGKEGEDGKPEETELEDDPIDHKINEPEPTDTPEELAEKLEEANDIVEKLQEEVIDQLVEIEELKKMNTELRTQLSAQIKKGVNLKDTSNNKALRDYGQLDLIRMSLKK